ncbi:NAD(P)-binding protein [Dendrothele bispora CBS 962.96]|uniref:NAD(P)-binding protein n=1 Tax=Dendrothele bispora (strain CBS 962.96) TaxID=1314807 RepID=A0A4S8LXA1_DENBC|nr:NAD(P)-binding protein [Dendrothele bispora CBS 962.96]
MPRDLDLPAFNHTGSPDPLIVVVDDLVATPSYLSHEEACTLPITALTTYNCFYGYDPILKAGDTVPLLGTGGCSIAGLQMALAAGCTTIITSSSVAKLQRAKDLGAHHIINYRETPDWGQEVKRVTNGRGSGDRR